MVPNSVLQGVHSGPLSHTQAKEEAEEAQEEAQEEARAGFSPGVAWVVWHLWRLLWGSLVFVLWGPWLLRVCLQGSLGVLFKIPSAPLGFLIGIPGFL